VREEENKGEGEGEGGREKASELSATCV